MADYDLRMTMSKHTPILWILPFLLLVPGLALARGPILILGDSLSATYGIDPSQGWVQLLDRRTPGIQVVNASISGETTAGSRVLLIGMHIPPNYGPTYTRRFHEVYRRLAEDYDLPWVPFLLKGVATHPELMQAETQPGPGCSVQADCPQIEVQITTPSPVVQARAEEKG